MSQRDGPWDPEPAALREGETVDTMGHAERNALAVRRARIELGLDPDGEWMRAPTVYRVARAAYPLADFEDYEIFHADVFESTLAAVERAVAAEQEASR